MDKKLLVNNQIIYRDSSFGIHIQLSNTQQVYGVYLLITQGDVTQVTYSLIKKCTCNNIAKVNNLMDTFLVS